MEEARRKRVAAKGWLTRVTAQLESFLEIETISEVELEELIVEFNNRLRNLDEMQSKVELVIDFEELENDIDEAAKFRSEKKSVLVNGKKRLLEIQRSRTESKPGSKSSSESSIILEPVGTNTTSNNEINTRLPTLQLSKFSGDYTEWQTFWDRFSAVVDSTSIPSINKFTYLQSLLQGEAASAIKGLSLTSSNYETAKEILLKRFGRPEKIIFDHIQQLLKNSVTSTKNSLSTPSGLWTVFDDIQNHVRCLENLGVDGDRYGVFLTPLVLNQLPSSIRLEWARVSEGREGDLKFLLDFLHEEIRRRERSQTFTSTSRQQGEPTRHQRHGAATALLTEGGDHDTFPPGGGPRKLDNLKKCVFCDREHYSDKCPMIKTLTYEQRKNKIKTMGLCFRCLGRHLSRNCEKRCFFCKSGHHSVLCKQRNETQCKQQIENDKQSPPAGRHEVQSTHQSVTYSNTGDKATLMQVVKIRVNDVEVHLLFDSGSDRSFIEASMANRLNLKHVGFENVRYSCFGEQAGRRGKAKAMRLFQFEHKGAEIKLLETPTICSPMQRAAVPPSVLLPFRDVAFTEEYGESEDVRIDILIGLDYYWELVGNNSRTENGLTAQETKFGWMLSGFWNKDLIKNGMNENVLSIMHCNCEISEDVIRKMWDFDTIGVSSQEEPLANDKIVETFRENIKMTNGRYEIKLPWKSEAHKKILMNNEAAALARLQNLNRKLRIDRELGDRYNAVLSDLENEGIIHEIPEIEMNTDRPVFYLPHRPVLKEESVSTKVRPVFDASAKGLNGVALNDCLEAGPNLLPDLVQVLVRFRRHKYALVADIKKAFLQIKLSEEERDVHRFLWDVNGVVRHMRFERVSFGVNSSPFLLNATIKFHLGKFEETRTVRELNENLYMDDLLTGADTEKELLQMITEAGAIMSDGGFTLTKWGSNCREVSQSVLKRLQGDLTEPMQTRKILGIAWNMKDDCFQFETLGFEQAPMTKRRLLSIIARIFDPLGILTPYSISLKILFQKAWRLGIDWDQNLPKTFQREANKWIEDLEEIRQWKIPRRLIGPGEWQAVNNNDVELICFSDASEKAYGCCIYLKTTTLETGETNVCLIMSRVRVAPLKRITLPRLELMAAVLAARLLKFVHSALHLDQGCKYTCYSDSQITLHWIKGNPSRWKQFVSNRVVELQNLTDPTKWRHCRGTDNPADLLTRGIDAETLSNSTLWLNGPSWLSESSRHPRAENLEMEDESAIEDLESVAREEFSKQIKTEQRKDAFTTLTVNDDQNINFLAEFDKIGRWEKLVRVYGWIWRFIRNCKARSKNNDRTSSDQLQSEEINDASERIILNVQKTHYPAELHSLQRGSVVDKKSTISSLSPFIGNDGALRVRGRLEFAPGLYYDEKHPIILPKCHISHLIVQAQHETMKHAGVNTLITAVRNKYWIVGVRTIAKRICKRCVRCQRQNSRPLDQVTAPLPEDRLTRSPPFHVTGVDHAGPLYCKDEENKMYILIFTCAVTRAVHLELVGSLSLDDFLMAFRRFSARRGLPTIIYSDNAKTFKGADQYIRKHFKQANINWKFNAPRAPWWGGWWERLIRSVKSGLKKSLGTDQVTRVELETTLHEVECCVNSRPLTYVEENKQPLTPSHFLIGRGSPLMSANAVEFSSGLMDLCEREIDLRKAIDRFWDLWRDDYIRGLPPLRLKKSNVDLKIGSVVIIKNEGKPRLMWPLGVVDKLYTGKDGLVRAVKLKTVNGFIDRPIQNLYKLEVDGENNDVRDSFPADLDEFNNDGLSLNNADGKGNDQSVFSTATCTKRGRLVRPRKILDL